MLNQALSMARLLPLLAGLVAAAPARADDAEEVDEDDPWGVKEDSPWDETPRTAKPVPAPPDPWAPPEDPVAQPPAPPKIPMGTAPDSLGFSSQARCRAAIRADRSGFQALTPTWAHPTLERCTYAAGADRWSIDEQPAAMVLSAGVDVPMVAAIGGLAYWASQLDPVQRGRENWDATSSSERGAVGTGAQRRDALSTRSEPDAVADSVSDVVLGASALGVLASPMTLPARNGRLTNFVVMTETVALNIAVQQVVARTVAEPRPMAFQDLSTWSDGDFAAVGQRLSSDRVWTSYYSGHTSVVASVGYGYATAFVIDNFDAQRESRGLSLLLYPAAFMLSNLQGQLRVDALEHDPTDVWIGHLAGGMIGTGVPLMHHLVALHGRNRPGAPRMAPSGPKAVVVRPMVSPDSVGLQGRW